MQFLFPQSDCMFMVSVQSMVIKLVRVNEFTFPDLASKLTWKLTCFLSKFNGIDCEIGKIV